MTEIAIAGYGVISRAGPGAEALWDPQAVAGWTVPPVDPAIYPAAKGLKRLPITAQWACLAAGEALDAAGDWSDADSTGVLVGTNRSSVRPITAFVEDARSHGVRLVNPTLFPDTVMNAVAGHVAIRYRLRGPTATFSGGRLTGYHALLAAVDLLRAGRMSRAIVCGTECLLPGTRSVPGYAASEGAGALLLEPASPGTTSRPLAYIQRVLEFRLPDRSNANETVWSILRQEGLTDEDHVVYPARMLRLPDGRRSTDIWALAGVSDGASNLFAVMAAVRALAKGHARAWVVEPGEESVAAVLLTAAPKGR